MKIIVEVEVPDGEKCIGCQFLDDRNKSYFGNSLRTADCNLFAGTFRLRGDETIYKNSDCLTARSNALDIALENLVGSDRRTPDVVRCGECEYWNMKTMQKFVNGRIAFCPLFRDYVYETFYCADGECREEE